MRETEIQRFINAAQAAIERVALSVPIAANGDATEREATALRAATVMRYQLLRIGVPDVVVHDLGPGWGFVRYAVAVQTAAGKEG